MKLIFLDMDGVMNSDRDFLPLGYHKTGQISTHPVGLFHVQCLRHIIEETGAKIVISSTWRHTFNEAQFEAIFKVFGCRAEVIGMTPITNKHRGAQIDQWIQENNFTGKFVILDDDTDMDPHMSKLVKTRTSEGLNLAQCEEVIKRLGRKDD